MFRSFSIRERAQIQLRGEFFNVLNRVNFNNPTAAISAGGFGSISGSFTPGTSITPGASAAELALQIKWGLGLGIKGLNLLNYIAFVPAVGQVTGSAVAGQLCQNYYGNFTISYNAEAQLAGFSYATPAKTLYKKSASFKQPGC